MAKNGRRTVTEPCRASDTVKTSQKLRNFLVAHDRDRTRRATRYFRGQGAIIFRLHPRTIITVPLPLHTLHSVGPDHVSRRTRPSPRLTYTRVNFHNNNFRAGRRRPGDEATWIKGHLFNQDHCSKILHEFSESWKYVMSDIVNQCRRSALLKLFGEDTGSIIQHSKCCDACEHASVSQEANL